MRSHGVVLFPDPGPNGVFSLNAGYVDPRSPQFQSANKVCDKLLPNGGQPTAAQAAQWMAEALKLSTCMQAHGIKDFPDPAAGALTLRRSPGSDLDPNNPRFQAAQKACESLFDELAAMPAGG
jgi:hypothetical protein